MPIISRKYLLRLVGQPDRTLVATAAFSGLRKSELKGLGWPDYDGETLTVARSMWRGFLGSTKAKALRAPVPVIPALSKILDEHRARSQNPAEGFIFLGPRLGRPINPDNLAHDHIRPALNRCTVCGKPPKRLHVGHDYRRDPKLPDWHGWQAFRRGLATNLQAMGIDDKTVQAILRHSDVTTTQKAYIKTLPPSVEAAMAKFGDEVSRVSVQ